MRQIGNGRYALTRELGRGGMGVVWLAEDRVLDRQAAVKELTLPAEVPEQQRAVYRERVVREARTASKLREPSVVTVYDLLTEDGRTYIVMEYVDAPTLADLIDRDGPMPTERVARLGGELLSALEAAHAAGIVHRDVKPGNVMVPAKGTSKLTDFGIAQSFTDPRLTSTGALIGTPSYMSPERLSGGEPSAAWDLWALGATLFCAVEGYDAFGRETVTATMLAVMTERAELARCTGPLAELIMGLLEPDPARRLTATEARPLLEWAVKPNGPKPTRLLPDPKPTLVDPDADHGPNPTAHHPGPTPTIADQPGPRPTRIDPDAEQPRPRTAPFVDPAAPPFSTPPGPQPGAPFGPGPDPFANHPHADRVRAQQAQAMARYQSFRRLTRIAMIAVPIIMVIAFIPLITTVFSTMNTLNQPILTPGATTGTTATTTETTTTTTKTSTPDVIAAMQALMTYGSDGDIPSQEVPFESDSCFAWLPTKGQPAPKAFDYVDCSKPHSVQAFGFGIITPDIEAPYPTAEQLTERATAQCTKQFLSTRITFKDKEHSLRYWVLVPTKTAWNPPPGPTFVPAARTYWCVAGRADGTQLTDTIE
ncbi:serine/threonine-protein kinase [Kutzneria chonburiensis]|uniref:non-specific serine/threonine protein kinase n=1 Tax=Kutzneria chonburiensis TaxID=1483604 RepID=A0ABV6MNZ5_9PSEU|nr:serine/threonine protein kinase [Kutzneria chonburiensis]